MQQLKQESITTVQRRSKVFILLAMLQHLNAFIYDFMISTRTCQPEGKQ